MVELRRDIAPHDRVVLERLLVRGRIEQRSHVADTQDVVSLAWVDALTEDMDDAVVRGRRHAPAALVVKPLAVVSGGVHEGVERIGGYDHRIAGFDLLHGISFLPPRPQRPQRVLN